MSWDGGDGVHEGWAARYFADDRLSCGWVRGELMMTGALGSVTEYDSRPEADAIGTQAACTCGWRGIRRPGVDPDDVKPGHWSDGWTHSDDCHAEWKHHWEFWDESNPIRTQVPQKGDLTRQ